ncbi:MAG: RNA polymerase subunit sigma [Planctomycetes bacterium]|nr:RNA polymerase subunit sigma [Planctomycetota bacterium]
MEPPSPDDWSRTIYDELHGIAARLLAGERAGRTLQPTVLVHEAYLRLVHLEGDLWRGRPQFFAVAGRAMRSILVDQARKRNALKRRADYDELHTNIPGFAPETGQVHVLDLEAALVELEVIDAELVRVVELLFFAGLTAEEAGSAMGVSSRTVKRHWRTARAWLHARLRGEEI